MAKEEVRMNATKCVRTLKLYSKQMLWCQLLTTLEQQSLNSELSHCTEVRCSLNSEYVCIYVCMYICTYIVKVLQYTCTYVRTYTKY